MTSQRRRSVGRACVLLVAVALLHCGGTGGGGNGDGGGNGEGGAGDVATLDGGDGGGGGGDGGGGMDAAIDALDPSEVASLSVQPGDATLMVTDPSVPQTQTFVAHARTRSGQDVVVPAAWSVDRTDVVSISAAGAATTTGTSGGDVVVTASYGTMQATATLRVVLAVTVQLPNTPTGTGDLFPSGASPGADPTRAPAIVYPASETIFPQNVYKILFQWRRGGNDRYRVNFDSDRVHLQVLTDGTHPDCAAAGTNLSCFEPTLALWQYIAASNPHGQVTVTVDGALSTTPGMFYRSAPITIGFSRGPVPGAIYYWSTTSAGVRRATVSDSAPTDFLTPGQTDGKCVACHTMSRRGNRLGADVGGSNLWVVEVSPTFPPPRLITQYNNANIPAAWNTFSFDETRIVTANKGVLTLRDGTNGAPLGTISVGTNRFGTQPDWSPDGTLLAIAFGPTNRDRGVAGARIATVAANGNDTFGAVSMLVGSGANNDTNEYPSFSWDSQWIAYTHATSDGENDNTCDLWLVGRDGAGSRALTRANTVVNDGTVTTATIEDSMPTWAPSGVPDDYAWVAFTSNRDYGGVLSSASHYGVKKQLWVAAIDPAALGGTGDPSYPAFRLPFQELRENTHRPFWAQDQVHPGDAGVDAGQDDAAVDAGGAPDAGSDAGSDAACVPLNGDCTSGACCPGLTCWDLTGNGNYQCTDVPM